MNEYALSLHSLDLEGGTAGGLSPGLGSGSRSVLLLFLQLDVVVLVLELVVEINKLLNKLSQILLCTIWTDKGLFDCVCEYSKAAAG